MPMAAASRFCHFQPTQARRLQAAAQAGSGALVSSGCPCLRLWPSLARAWAPGQWHWHWQAGRSGQVRFITRPKSRTMRAKRKKTFESQQPEPENEGAQMSAQRAGE